MKTEGEPENGVQPVEYKVYPQRWWVLWTTVGIQVFNFAHIAAFPSVNKVLSKYYHQVWIQISLGYNYPTII